MAPKITPFAVPSPSPCKSFNPSISSLESENKLKSDREINFVKIKIKNEIYFSIYSGLFDMVTRTGPPLNLGGGGNETSNFGSSGFAPWRNPCRLWNRRDPPRIQRRRSAFIARARCSSLRPEFGYPSQRSRSKKSLGVRPGNFAGISRGFYESLRGLPWQGWRRFLRNRPESLSQGARLAVAGNAKPYRRRDPLHYFKRRKA